VKGGIHSVKKHISVQRKVKGAKGQGLTEYVLIIGFVALAVITLLGTLGGKIKELYSSFLELFT
jgi:Flp pilus assembly pilin Flp